MRLVEVHWSYNCLKTAENRFKIFHLEWAQMTLIRHQTYNNGSLNVYHTNTFNKLLSEWREKNSGMLTIILTVAQQVANIWVVINCLFSWKLVCFFLLLLLATTMIIGRSALIGEITNWTASTNIASVIIAVNHLLWRKNANQVYKKKQVRKRMLKSAKGRENYKSRTHK